MTIPVPDGSVIVTPAQMFAEMREMHDEVKALKNVLDPALTDIRTDVKDHELRLRSVEKRIWMASGVAALVSSGAVAIILELLARKH